MLEILVPLSLGGLGSFTYKQSPGDFMVRQGERDGQTEAA